MYYKIIDKIKERWASSDGGTRMIKKIISLMLVISIIFMVACSKEKNGEVEEGNSQEEHMIVDKEEEDQEVEEKPVDEIQLKINKMSLEEKIGQLLLVGIDGYDMNDPTADLIQNYRVGGVILYGRNVKGTKQLLDLTNALKTSNTANNIPLFISVDEEGGAVSRSPKEVKKLPTARAIGKTEDVDLAYEVGNLLGAMVKSFGYNMNFAPVLDIDSNPANPVIEKRSFGKTPDIVSKMGIAEMKGMASEGVIPVVKHFPGHGDTSVDSHIGLPIIHHELERIMDFEAAPFKSAIEEGAEVVMVAHILLKKIDAEKPASMSKIIITDILRENLGFGGVVITDDMTMGAISKNYDMAAAVVSAINAGADIILVGHQYENAIAAFNGIKKGIEEGRIKMDRLDESVHRILSLKNKYNIKNTLVESMDVQKINDRIDKVMDKIN